MEKQELIETILSSDLSYVSFSNETYLIAKNKQNEGIYLIWGGKKKLESTLTENVYRQCILEQKKHNLTPVYHIYARSITYQSSSITFNKIPDKILIDFGVDPTTDTFIDDDLNKSQPEK